ncbi:MAG: YraN family protein [Actinobacteria bacterium]|nr:YraN family protein [Actinomycetota bacterium]
MGVGHVPQDPVHPDGEGPQFQGRERGGTPGRHAPRHGRNRTPRLARARWAEDLAARWYERRGFTIVARNWTMRGGEIDVVARRGSLLVVCEVKARASAAWGSPWEAMTPLKQQRVRRAGHAFVRGLGERGLRVRFDVAAVTGTRLEVMEDAF